MITNYLVDEPTSSESQDLEKKNEIAVCQEIRNVHQGVEKVEKHSLHL